jgi:malonyl CoA-acyl carrier protein transacylase/phosphopantetheinyl transferase
MPTASSSSTPAEVTAASDRRKRPPRLLPAELFLLTAESRAGLVGRMDELEAHLGRPSPAALHDLAFTVSRSYDPALECLAIVASSHADLRAKLARAREKLAADGRIQDRDGIYYATERLGTGKVAFMFPGENAQYSNMLRELCVCFPEVREAFDAADAASCAEEDGYLPSAVNFPPPGSNGAATDEMAEWEKAVSLVHTANTAMTRLLQGLEIRPDAVLGHSFGEMSALEMAGVLRTGEGADRLRYVRQAYLHFRELSRDASLPVGRLLAVGGVESAQIEHIVSRFPDTLRVAMENCPHQFVLCASGPRMDEAMAEAQRWLSEEGALCSPLPIGRPYHTGFFEPAYPLQKANIDRVGVHPARLEVYSCSTTEPFPPEPEAIAEVATRHWMSCVRFQRTIEKMHDRGFRVFVEVGPRGNLCGFVDDILGGRPHVAVPLNRPNRSDVLQLLNALAILAAHGVPLRVHHLHERWSSRAVDLSRDDSAGVPKGSLILPLKTVLPTFEVERVAATRREAAPAAPSGGPPAPPPAFPAEAPREIGRAVLPPSTADDETASVMLSYIDTMERFLVAQGTLMTSLLGTPLRDHDAAPAEVPGRCPLLGEVLDLVPGESLTARRVLDVEEDLFLGDHALGTTVSATDPSLKALPVMPLTFSFEVAAEAGALLFPDRTVTAVLDFRAHRWIFLDRGAVALRVTARRMDAPDGNVHVRVTIQQETHGDPGLFPTMVEVTSVLGAKEEAPRRSLIADLPPSAACHWTVGDVYPTRTFHGPLFQGVRGISRLSDAGLDGTLEVLPWSGLMRRHHDPDLKLDPLLIDMLGQAVWLWGSREPFLGQAYLPFGGRAVRTYGPRLPAGTRLELRLRVRHREPQTVVADLEAVDSQGNVRLAIEELSDREFTITPALHRLMLEPLDRHFAEVRALDLPLLGAEPSRVFLATVAGFPQSVLEGAFGVWRKALAFLVLGRQEREEWQRLEVPLRREIHWLLGRTAAKDALRALVRERGGPRLGCADLALRNDPGGRPVVAGGWPLEWSDVAQVSISHTEGLVAAAAAAMEDGVHLGVDTEMVRTPSMDLVDGAFSREELALLPPEAAEAEREEWVFRFWCAKEAVGKAQGTGVPLDPRELTVTRGDRGTGLLAVRPATGKDVPVTTMRMDHHVVAIAAVDTRTRH